MSARDAAREILQADRECRLTAERKGATSDEHLAAVRHWDGVVHDNAPEVARAYLGAADEIERLRAGMGRPEEDTARLEAIRDLLGGES